VAAGAGDGTSIDGVVAETPVFIGPEGGAACTDAGSGGAFGFPTRRWSGVLDSVKTVRVIVWL
jgi:hypothetical protein